MLNSAPNPWPCLVFCFFLTSPTSPTSGWDLTWSNASPLRWFHRAVSPDRSRLFGSFAPQMCSCSALMPSRARVQALPRWSSEISWISSNTATAQCPDWNDLHLSWTNVCICIWYTYMYMIYIYVCVYIRMCLCIYIYNIFWIQVFIWDWKKLFSHCTSTESTDVSRKPVAFHSLGWLNGTLFTFIGSVSERKITIGNHVLFPLMFCRWFLVSFFPFYQLCKCSATFNLRKSASVYLYVREAPYIHLLDPI